MTEPLSVTAFADSFRAFLDAVQAGSSGGLIGRIADHLGVDPHVAPAVTEELQAYERPSFQRALDDMLAEAGTEYDQIGVAMPNKRFMSPSFSDLLTNRVLGEGPVEWVNVRLAGDEVLPCMQSGLLLVRGAQPYAVFVSGPASGRPDASLRIEVVAPDRARAEAVLARLREGMLRLDVHRGHVLSLTMTPYFGPQGAHALLTFNERPATGRDDIVLPDEVLARIERHTIGFSRHAPALKDAGLSLRRGILLYGPPGVGKTHTARYLTAAMPERTVLLLAGVGMGALNMIAELARRLAPSLVILEDIDLIAEERTMRTRGASQTFLFELLNEMDGLRDDADVIFVLTTNRADLLEPALALRPGRVDLAVELPLPDPDGRARLLELYAAGLDSSTVDFSDYVDALDGTSPAYIRELVRQAALRAIEAGRPGRLEPDDLEGAQADLAHGGELAQRLLGGTAPPPTTPHPVAFPDPSVMFGAGSPLRRPDGPAAAR